jgi:hypothetical protein
MNLWQSNFFDKFKFLCQPLYRGFSEKDRNPTYTGAATASNVKASCPISVVSRHGTYIEQTINLEERDVLTAANFMT